MKRLVLAIFLFIFAVMIGLIIARHPAPIAFELNGWQVQAPIGLVIVAGIVLFLVLYCVVRFIGVLWRLPRRLRENRVRRRQEKLAQNTHSGLKALQLGHFKEAQRHLSKTLWAGENVSANYLLCARAAHEQKDHESRDRYLQRARALGKDAAFSADLIMAEFCIHTHDYQKARSYLEALHAQKPKQAHILKLLAKTYAGLGDWPQIMLLMPKLRKLRVLDPAQNTDLEKNVYQSLIEHTAETDPVQLISIWNKLPRFMQQDPHTIALYCHGLMQQGERTSVEKLLRHHLNKKWDSALVELYGDVDANLSHQLVCAERWLKNHGDEDPALLLCLARLCKRSQLWGKARAYFEKRIQLQPSSEIYAELAEVHEHLGETAAALACYKKGVKGIRALTAPPPPALPLH